MKSGALQTRFQQIGKQILHFRVPLFICLVLLVYAFIVMRVNALKNAQPSASQTAIATHNTTSATPHIDQATIQKIRQLQDNSVSLQALFNQARQNPFQE